MVTSRICKGDRYRRTGEEIIEVFVLCAGMDKEQTIESFDAVRKRADELLSALKALEGKEIRYWFQPGRTRKPEHRRSATFNVVKVSSYKPVIRVYGYNGNHTRIMAEIRVQTKGLMHDCPNQLDWMKAVESWLKTELGTFRNEFNVEV
jgi:hypothetical protein